MQGTGETHFPVAQTNVAWIPPYTTPMPRFSRIYTTFLFNVNFGGNME